VPRISIFEAVADPKYGDFDGIASRSDEREGLGALPSRREFLIGSGAVLTTALPEAALLADAALLASLTLSELELVREVMAAYPALSLANAVERLQEAGM
jgi:hypothetical protein